MDHRKRRYSVLEQRGLHSLRQSIESRGSTGKKVFVQKRWKPLLRPVLRGGGDL